MNEMTSDQCAFDRQLSSHSNGLSPFIYCYDLCLHKFCCCAQTTFFIPFLPQCTIGSPYKLYWSHSSIVLTSHALVLDKLAKNMKPPSSFDIQISLMLQPFAHCFDNAKIIPSKATVAHTVIRWSEEAERDRCSLYFDLCLCGFLQTLKSTYCQNHFASFSLTFMFHTVKEKHCMYKMSV